MTIEERDIGGYKVDGTHISGLAVPYNRDSKVLPGPRGPFVERIEPGAGSSHVRDERVMFNYQHEARALLPLGRVGKNLELRVADAGIEFDLELPNTSLGRDVAELMRTEILPGRMSFGMQKIKATTRREGAIERRSVSDFALHHLALVIEPAYVSTSAQLRSIDDIHRFWLEACFKHRLRT